MSTDRELLENAAKAAGYGGVINFGDEIGVMVSCGPSASKFQPWNPLTDDSEALRLAVKLCIVVAPYVGYSMADDQHVDAGEDINAATRRAIVRAAASIREKRT